MSLLQKILVGRWIVGTTIDEAISKSISLSDIGINSMINYLGEDTYEKKTAEFSTSIFCNNDIFTLSHLYLIF